MNSFGTKIYKDLSSHHIDTTECLKGYATTIASLSQDVDTINKHLMMLQTNILSKSDVECIVIQKWQDELDPHIQSHYEFKQEATTKLNTIDQAVQNAVDHHLKSHPLLQSSSNSTLRSPATPSTGFHQLTSKDFSVFKLQKELKEIKLSGDSLKDIEIFWDAVLRAFTNLCQVNQAYPYYRDLTSTFSFKKAFCGIYSTSTLLTSQSRSSSP
jgi:hypothetical protein